MKHFTYIKNPYLNSQYGNSQIMTQKNTYKGGSAKHAKTMN